MDDFELACKGLYRALSIRQKYMRLAYQRFPMTVSQHLCGIEGKQWKAEDQVHPGTTLHSCGLMRISEEILEYAEIDESTEMSFI